MVHKKGGKSFFAFAICLVVCCVLVGCSPNLGNIENEEDFYKKFPSVKFVGSNLEVVEKESKYLYNESAVNDFNHKDFESPIESDAYKYMAVVVGENVSVEEFAIYVRSDADVIFSVYAYAKSLPQTIATGGESDFETYTDKDGNEKTRLKEFDEPKNSDAVASKTVSLKKGEWTALYIRSFDALGSGKSALQLQEGSCLLFQFANNCVAYDQEGNLIENEYPSANVSFTAMLIRVG